MKVRRCFWVDDSAFLMLQGKCIDPSTLINRIITLFLDLPEDPREKLLLEKSEEVMIRLRIQYEREIRDRIRESATQQQVQDLAKTAADQRSAELLEFGADLRKIPCFPKLLQVLGERNTDSNYLQVALVEFNQINGCRLEDYDLWNTALAWYDKFGKLEQAAQPQ